MKKTILPIMVAAALMLTACGQETVEPTTTVTESSVAIESSVEESEVSESETSAAESEAVEETDVVEESEVVIADEAILGAWNTTVDEGVTAVYTFNEDGTGVITMTEGEETADLPFTYSIAEAGTISLTIEGEETSQATYTIDGETMSMVQGEETAEFTR